MHSLRLIYTTWPDAESAGAAATAVVTEGLCACANILPGMTSVYRWRGEIAKASECVAVFKTTQSAAKALVVRLAELHPYDEPALIGLPVDADSSAPGFLAWVASEADVQ
ncbi:divalent-cation tolerance protein CutA [Maricaulis maris]|uniref:divalent-cation tolerance protein CutA n=1 Tax=Maricaulis maris TaxID=74318 RepID=UPI003B8BB126